MTMQRILAKGEFILGSSALAKLQSFQNTKRASSVFASATTPDAAAGSVSTPDPAKRENRCHPKIPAACWLFMGRLTTPSRLRCTGRGK
jgi:hypothetical protein